MPPNAPERESPPDFRRIPTVLTSQELVDKAFLKASKISVFAKDSYERVKGTEIARLRSVQNSTDATLAGYVKAFPSFDRLPPFYRDLARVLVDVDAARQSLGAIDWARGQIMTVGDEAALGMKRAGTADEIVNARKRAYGRIASILERVDSDLTRLNGVRDKLRAMPTIDAAVPTIVVAGYPNVGKSSLIRRVSTAEPEVAAYPFTTKGLQVGHFTLRRVTYQIVDTPGLLDRPLDERNAIEQQAIAALRHLGDAVVFILDPSELCGYDMDAQERLLVEAHSLFDRARILVVENKVDVEEGRFTHRADRLRMSTGTGEGVEAVVEAASREALDAWKARAAL